MYHTFVILLTEKLPPNPLTESSQTLLEAVLNKGPYML